VDAKVVAAPRQRNSRDKNVAIKTGETPNGPITETNESKLERSRYALAKKYD